MIRYGMTVGWYTSADLVCNIHTPDVSLMPATTQIPGHESHYFLTGDVMGCKLHEQVVFPLRY